MQRTAIKDILLDNRIHMIIPVPLHQKRYLERGFNQTEILADFLHILSSVPIHLNCLKKTKHTRTQTGLNRQGRKNNITKGVFEIKAAADIKEKNVLLVDDIITTGATLDRCAEKLLTAGAKAVYGFTIAKTM